MSNEAIHLAADTSLFRIYLNLFASRMIKCRFLDEIFPFGM